MAIIVALMDAPPIQYARTRDGYDIAYMASGEGRPLVLLPATQNHISHYWRSPHMRPAFQQLAARFRLIQYDARGQGHSSRGLRDGLTPADWMLDLDAVVESEGIGRFILFDQHGRGYVAANYALQHPDRIDALVLLNIALSRTLPASLDAVVKENWGFAVQATGPMVLPWEDPQRAREIMADIWDQADLGIVRRAFTNVPLEDAWRRVQTPALVLASKDGTYLFGTESNSRRLAALIPDARLVVFDGAGGGMFGYGSDEPPAPQIIQDFVESLASRPARRPEGPGLPATPLSARELEVLRLVAHGKSNRQIAAELVISTATVAKHVNSILAKTESTNRAGAAGFAHRHGIL